MSVFFRSGVCNSLQELAGNCLPDTMQKMLRQLISDEVKLSLVVPESNQCITLFQRNPESLFGLSYPNFSHGLTELKL